MCGLLRGRRATCYVGVRDDVKLAGAAYSDEPAAPTGKSTLRFVHDSPGTPAVDVGLGTGTGFVPLFVNVSYPNITAAGGAIDANGYLTADPINASVANPVLITARVNPAGPEALNIPLTFPAPAGTVATAFATGLLASTATPLQVLLCLDNAPPTGNLATCILAP